MRKKTYFTLALFGAVLGMGAFSSCKDTNEDLYNEIRLKETGDYNYLLSQIQKLEQQLLAIQLTPGPQGEKGDKGEDGQDGVNGTNGLSAYEIWLALGNEGSEQDFIDSLKGEKGDKGDKGDPGNGSGSGEPGDPGNQGPQGEPGLSAYDIWLQQGYVGTETDFLFWLMGQKGDKGDKGENGADGADGLSAYQIWMNLGMGEDLDGDGDIDEVDFILSLKGEKGDKGDKGDQGNAGEQGNPGEPGTPGSGSSCGVDCTAIYNLLLDITQTIDATQGDIDSATITNWILEVNAAIAKLNNVIKAVADMITDIRVELVDNPVLGGLNTPLDIKFNTLIACRSSYTGSVDFPDFSRSVPAGADDDLWDWAAYEDGLTYPSSNNGGTVYVTINPASVDYSGKTVELVNSQGVAVASTTLQKSSKVLTFGATRADNGLYEGKFELSDGVKHFALDEEQLKTTAKGIKDAAKEGNIIDVLNTLYHSVDAISDAYGLKAVYNTVDANGNVKQTSTTSAYDMAALSIQPINFEQLKAVDDFLGTHSDDTDLSDYGFITSHVNGSLLNLMQDLIDKAINKGFSTLGAPALLYSATTGACVLSSNPSAPTVVKASEYQKLIATSNSVEYLVPFYKKFVAITKVNGVPATAADNVGVNVNQVFAGAADGYLSDADYATAVIPTLLAGNTYELTYYALDYNGNTQNKHYYVTVQ